MLNALKTEILLRKDYLKGDRIESVYFGGGTPSLFTVKELQSLVDLVSDNFTLIPDPEITVEANPDDLSDEWIDALPESSINRLSIGIQSFNDQDLKFMNRAHNALDAELAVSRAQRAGIRNISIDLMYGLPDLTVTAWKKNIAKALEQKVPHLSCYCLTIEKGTVLHHMVKKGKVIPLSENDAASQFEILMEFMQDNGYRHYEISNFGKEGYFSKHNLSYWSGKKYLGIGPSAHSYDGKSRQWNIASNPTYIKAISNNKIPAEIEFLPLTTQFNEMIMLSLRTMWGIDLQKVKSDFGVEMLVQLENNASEFVKQGNLINENNNLKLSTGGKLLADYIASALFITGTDH
jgi:oxygen-independent coproporphyrinogen III oxidase